MSDDTGLVRLRDGAKLIIREVGRADRAALLAGFERLSEESRTMRFFTGMPRLTASTIEYLTDIDQNKHVALGVFDPLEPSDVGTADGLGVGVGRYFVSSEDPTLAEAAVTVIDSYQGRGIGTLLLEALVVVARERGVKTFLADVMAENTGMAAVLTKLGARPISVEGAGSEIRFEVDVPAAVEPVKSSASYRVMRQLAAARWDDS